MGPECQCGCGELLPEGSLRAYKRGHKRRAIEAENNSIAGVEPYSSESEMKTDEESPFNRLSALIENDPESATMRKDFGKKIRASASNFKITTGVRKDVEGKLAFMLLMTSNAVQIADPVCGGVLAQQSGEIAEKLTPILCQSPAVVQWFQKGTSIIMYVDLLMALAPVATTVFAHHFSRREEMPPEVPFDDSYYQVRR